MRIQKSLATVVVLLAALWGSSAAQAFILSDLSGERTTLQEYVGDGRWTLVMIWQLECVICEEQKPALNAFHQKYKGHLARVVGLSIDGMERKSEIDARIGKNGDSYDNLIAFTDVYRKQYQELTGKAFRAAPTFLFFDPAGNLVGTNFGYLDFEGIARNMAAASAVSN